MSIEVLRHINRWPHMSRNAPEAGTPGAADSRFDTVLEQVGRRQPGETPTAEQALLALKVTQLKMMQGLFSTDEDDSGSGSGLGDTASLSLFADRSRFIDSYRRQMPSLTRPEESVGREGIERMIDRVAEKVSLAPELIRAVVTVESSYDPQAVSPVGAQGLMQLMPSTAAELGVKNSFDPQENLEGGSRYLSGLLKKYEGDLDRALAAYNWGQGNVDRHGLDRMPAETRNYLAKIKQILAG